jgi:ribonuclease HI
MDNKIITINTDGGSRGNPGSAAYAFVVKENGEVIYEQKETIGIATNNKAEYTGVMKAMEWLITKSKIQNPRSKLEIQFILDSELVVRQLTGVYKIKDKNIMEYVKTIKANEKNLQIPVSYTYVPRAENWEADALVNQALDELK